MMTRRRELLWIALPGLAVIGAAGWYFKPPTRAFLPNPIASFPFDVSHRGSTVDAVVQIPQHRSWLFAVSVNVTTGDQATHVESLFESARLKGVGGIKAQIHLAILDLGANDSVPHPLIDETFDRLSEVTLTTWEIATINLKPGRYHITATIVTDNPEIDLPPAHLTIRYYAYHTFTLNAMDPLRSK